MCFHFNFGRAKPLEFFFYLKKQKPKNMQAGNKKRKIAGVSPTDKNVYVPKDVKDPAKPRPPLPAAFVGLSLIKKGMPLDKFLHVMNEPKNHKIFKIQIRMKTPAGNRGTCYALLQMLEGTYGKFMEDCQSDLTCLVALRLADGLDPTLT